MHEKQEHQYKKIPIQYFIENEIDVKTASAMMIMDYIKTRNNECTLSKKSIAEKFNMSEKTIATYMKELEKRGLIEKIESRAFKNRFKIKFDLDCRDGFISLSGDYANVIKEGNITFEEIFIHSTLLIESDEGKCPIPAQTLADIWKVSRRTVAGIIDSLVKKRLIEKHVCEDRKSANSYKVMSFDRESEKLSEIFERYRYLHMNTFYYYKVLTLSEKNCIIEENNSIREAKKKGEYVKVKSVEENKEEIKEFTSEERFYKELMTEQVAKTSSEFDDDIFNLI